MFFPYFDNFKFIAGNPGLLKENVHIITSKTAIDLLETIPIEKCTTMPPSNPKNGDVFLFFYENEENKHDYLSDAFTWDCRGNRKLPKTNPTYLKRYFHRRLKNSRVDFYKHSYQLNDSSSRKILIHYFGKDDKVVHEDPHGNRKHHKIRSHIRTMKSVLNKIENANDQPGTIYKKLVTKAVPDGFEKVAKPKNLKQIQNKQAYIKRKNIVDTCEISSMLVINSEVGDYIKDLTLIPSLNITLINDTLLRILKEEIEKCVITVLSYDTTYNMGDFYVSTIVARHSMFEENPAYLLSCLLHHKRDAWSHTVLLKRIQSSLPSLNSKKVVFVTDREGGIISAISSVFHNAHKVICWNHIKQDIKVWIKSKGGNSEDKTAYMAYVVELLNSSNDQELNEKIEEFSKEWSLAFLAYFNVYLKKDIKSSYKGKLDSIGIFDQESGITINISEGLNTVYKRLTEWKELRLDSMVLCFHFLSCYYIKEISRGFNDLGNWHIIEKYRGKIKKFKSFDSPVSSADPDEIIQLIKNQQKLQGLAEKDQHSKAKSLKTQESLAKYLVKQNLVTLDARSGTFLVDTLNRKRHAVVLNELSCSCSSNKICVHIMAAKFAARDCLPKVNKPVFSLTKLCKMKTKKKKKGKKARFQSRKLT